MTDAQFYNKFMQVLDKGIALYTEALNTERGDCRGWLGYSYIDFGLCWFFQKNGLHEVANWIEDIARYGYLCTPGIDHHKTRHERFAKRLQILQQIKKELE